MKNTVLILYLSIVSWAGYSQRTQIVDSLKKELNAAKQDTSKVLIMSELSFMLGFLQPDSGLVFAQNALDIANRINYFRGQVRALISMGFCYSSLGDLPRAMDLQFQGLRIAEEKNYKHEYALCMLEIGNSYSEIDIMKGVEYIKKAKLLNEADRNDHAYEFLRNRIDLNLGRHYIAMDQLDSAFVYLEAAYDRTLSSAFFHPPLLMFFGELQFKLGNPAIGINYLHQSIRISLQSKDHVTGADAYRRLAEMYSELNLLDSALYYAKLGLAEAQTIDYKTGIFQNSSLLANLYESRDVNKAYQYLKIAYTANEEIRGPEKIKELQKQVTDEQEHQRKIEAENLAYKNRIKTNAFLGSFFTLLVIAILLYRNNRQKHRSKRNIEVAYERLKSTQSQLIQSEKMASLGELTAGIAHEIQNPLNFVNNFSEVNNELIEELRKEIAVGSKQSQEEIVNDIKSNSEKINHHGKRADAIVKSMLQHSRTSSGKKELTDVNSLCDEYLRLSYHGLRAKDKSFNAKFEMDFDPTLPKVNVVQQDIGRVLLNLINNAFYAINEKAKLQITDYQPRVTVSTKALSDKIEIRVQDNGNGIPESIKEKVFQPFFTTKPTGRGTGLGLSLSYDIITKSHGGELKLETKEREGTTFIVTLKI